MKSTVHHLPVMGFIPFLYDEIKDLKDNRLMQVLFVSSILGLNILFKDYLTSIVGFLGFTLITYSAAYYWSFRIEITATHLNFSCGIINSYSASIHRSDIDVVDTKSSFLEMILGISMVRVYATGATSSAMAIPYLDDRLVNVISVLARSSNQQQTDHEYRYSLNWKDSLKGSLLPSTKRLLYSAMLSLLAIQALMYKQVPHETLMDVDVASAYSNNVSNMGLTNAGIFLVGLVGILFVLGNINRIIWVFPRFLRTEVEVRKGEIAITKGIFNRSTVAIPVSKITGIEFSNGKMSSLLKGRSVFIHTFSNANSAIFSSNYIPFLPENQLKLFCASLSVPLPPVAVHRNIPIRMLLSCSMEMFTLLGLVFLLVISSIPANIVAEDSHVLMTMFAIVGLLILWNRARAIRNASELKIGEFMALGFLRWEPSVFVFHNLKIKASAKKRYLSYPEKQVYGYYRCVGSTELNSPGNIG